MLTLKEEILKMQLKDKLDEADLDEAIKFLFNSDILDNFNLAFAFFSFLLAEINLEWSDEIQSTIINIMGKKNNIEDLSKYNELNVTALNILRKWKREKDDLVNMLIEIVRKQMKTK